MGESIDDRINFLYTLSTMDPPPESVPINSLVPVEGTPLENTNQIETFEWIRMIALARTKFCRIASESRTHGDLRCTVFCGSMLVLHRRMI